jgi:cation transport ATPase
MKARYPVILCILALLVNAFSIYNFLLAIGTIFLFLLILIPHLFIKVTSSAKKLDESKQNFATRQIGNYGKQKTTRKMNRFSIIFAIIVINIMAITFIIITYTNLSAAERFISQHITWAETTPVLAVIGTAFFIASVFLVTANAVKTLRKENLFKP